jgi:hypothetical protein
MTATRRPLLTVVLTIVIAGSGSPQAQSQTRTCNDPMPQDCTRVKALGEDTTGCACFVCNPEGPNRTVVCTNDEVMKKKLRDIAAG